MSLEEADRIARAHHATINDVLIAALGGSLRSYLQSRGRPVQQIQAVVPFNLRPLDEPVPRELGNRFGLVLVPLPVGLSGSARGLTEVHERMREIKTSGEGAVAYAAMSLVGTTPEPLERRLVQWWTGKGSLVMTNVPGPKETVYLAGAPVRTVLFWAPASGQIAMSVSIFSYGGQVTVGVMADATLIPDPGEIATGVQRQVEELGELAAPARPRRSRRQSAPAGRAQSGRARPRRAGSSTKSTR